MGRINTVRVLLGGLLSGAVINVLEMLSSLLYAQDFAQAMAEHNVDINAMTPTSMAMFLLLGFIAGFGGVGLYAAMLPRFGPGIGTAVKAGVIVWLLGYFSSAIGFTALGIYPANMFLIIIVIGLVEIVLGTILGSKVYREA